MERLSSIAVIGRRVALAVIVVGAAFAARPAAAQVTAQTLIGKAVSDDSQSKDINNAITRFRDRDIDGCRAVLERAKTNNPKLPPPGVMMAMLWLSVNQLAPARGELEDTAVKFGADPEPYLMLGDLAFQDRRITDAAVLFDKATALAATYEENPKRKRDFDIRCNAGSAAVAEARRQWENAQKHLAAWIELDPDNASAHQRMGIVLFQLNKQTDALAQFREAKKLDEKAVQPELAMARLYDDAKKRDVAKKLVEAAIKAVIDGNPGQVAAYKAKPTLFGWFVGQVMKSTGGKANPKVVNELLKKALDA